MNFELLLHFHSMRWCIRNSFIKCTNKFISIYPLKTWNNDVLNFFRRQSRKHATELVNSTMRAMDFKRAGIKTKNRCKIWNEINPHESLLKLWVTFKKCNCNTDLKFNQVIKLSWRANYKTLVVKNNFSIYCSKNLK